MKKISTGRILKVEEFRKLKQCPICRRMVDMHTKICEECAKLDIKKCKYCGIILREIGFHRYYAYDTNMDLREKDSWKTNKRNVNEFILEAEVYHPKYNEEECSGCHETKQKILDKPNKYNKCYFEEECHNKLVEGEDLNELVDFISKNGRVCRGCQFRKGFV